MFQAERGYAYLESIKLWCSACNLVVWFRNFVGDSKIDIFINKYADIYSSTSFIASAF